MYSGLFLSTCIKGNKIDQWLKKQLFWLLCPAHFFHRHWTEVLNILGNKIIKCHNQIQTQIIYCICPPQLNMMWSMHACWQYFSILYKNFKKGCIQLNLQIHFPFPSILLLVTAQFVQAPSKLASQHERRTTRLEQLTSSVVRHWCLNERCKNPFLPASPVLLYRRRKGNTAAFSFKASFLTLVYTLRIMQCAVKNHSSHFVGGGQSISTKRRQYFCTLHHT